MIDLEFEIAELNRRVANLLRVGSIVDTDYANARARVTIGDITTGWLDFMTQRAGGDRTWWAPEIGEQVMVLSPSGDLAQGKILPALYSAAAPAPAGSPDIHKEVHADGFSVTHDRANKRTVLDAWDSQGTIEIRAKNIILKTGDGGFYHIDHAGLATRITHQGGVNYDSESWQTGAVVTGIPDYGHNPPEVDIP